MYVMFRSADDWAMASRRDLGIHIHAYQVAINPEADGAYLALEDMPESVLYRLQRDGLIIRRIEVEGGTIERDDRGKVAARWWFTEELGTGNYQAIAVNSAGRKQVIYVDIGEDGRFWNVDDDATWAIEALFGDCPRDDTDCDYPSSEQLDAMIAELPTALAAD